MLHHVKYPLLRGSLCWGTLSPMLPRSSAPDPWLPLVHRRPRPTASAHGRHPFSTSTPSKLNSPEYNVSSAFASEVYLLREVDLQGLVYRQVGAWRFFREVDIKMRQRERFGSIEEIRREKDRRKRKAADRQEAVGPDVDPTQAGASAVTPHSVPAPDTPGPAPSTSWIRSAWTACTSKVTFFLQYVRRGLPVTGMDASLSSYSTSASQPRTSNASQLLGQNAALSVGLGGNLAILLLKAGTAVASGSATMLVESLHSFIDAANQFWLTKSSATLDRPSDSAHPYGYAGGLHIFVLGATGTAFLGGFAGFVHSAMALMEGTHIVADLSVAATLLLVCACIEGGTLYFAWRQCRVEAARLDLTPGQYVYDSMADPRTLFILAEDASALLSCAFGAFALMLAQWTGLAIFDVIGTAGIVVILFLQFQFVWRRTLVAVSQPSVHLDLVQRIRLLVLSDHMVSSVHDVKATVLGPFAMRFKAEVNVNSRAVAQSYMGRHIDLQRLTLGDPEAVQKFVLEHGTALVHFNSDEMDRIERRVKEQFPVVKHVDLKPY